MVVYNVMVFYVDSDSKRTYTSWSEESKTAFDSQFQDYIEKDRGYPSTFYLIYVCCFDSLVIKCRMSSINNLRFSAFFISMGFKSFQREPIYLIFVLWILSQSFKFLPQTISSLKVNCFAIWFVYISWNENTDIKLEYGIRSITNYNILSS